MIKRLEITLLVVVLFFFLSLNTVSAFSGTGTGTPNDPFQITTINQLDEIRNNLSASYILMNDLSFDGSDLIWEPIGNFSESTGFQYFTGNFDGNNQTIYHLIIDKPDQDNIGIFGCFAGSVSNLNIENATVKGNNSVGIVAANGTNIQISNCHVANSSVCSNMDAGGIAGTFAIGQIQNCSVLNSTISSTEGCGGGIVATNNKGEIINSYVVNISVTAGSSAGGISGLNNFGSKIETCSAIDSTVESNSYGAGGISGWSIDTVIENCYATGNITSDGFAANAGGISGSNYNVSLQNCYSTAFVTSKGGLGNAGGIIGVGSGCHVADCVSLNHAVNQRTPLVPIPPKFSLTTYILLKIEMGAGYIAGNNSGVQVNDCYYWNGIESNKIFPSHNGQKINSKMMWNTFPSGIWKNWNPEIWELSSSEYYKLPVLKGQPNPEKFYPVN
ncbi:GLUG motif-containing protein [Methanolapillus millepedarum]|uniref:GLUG domain-containing protein n=1 Tax=Methanolapillus millepedarum TaxID=3028296 RepID=A0AA96ZVP3_9EURY|nr:hypothetical protein MsAc7_12280 [Methanosarcinaceae archaeon Ac7]